MSEKPHHHHHHHAHKETSRITLSWQSDAPLYATSFATNHAPRHKFPASGIPAKAAEQLIKDELTLDGCPRQNLASFVTTWMEPEAESIMLEGMSKNFIDFDEYPTTTDIHNRCVNILSALFNAPASENELPGVGTGTIGSSEAIMLAALNMKWKWREARKKKGLDIERPNLVFGANVQVCWHKACKYFDIEMREADVSRDCLCLTAERARSLIDERTIGVCPILGSTFNGEFEDVKGIHDMVAELNEKNGWKIPIHVDAASGGFIAPFITPDLLWDFRLPWVKSINASGHKFGLVYAGVGWVIFRELADLHDELVFHVNYLGGDQASFTLNFSRCASNILGQYYQIVRLGHEGYRQIMMNGMQIAAHLRKSLLDTGRFVQVDKAHMPLVSVALKDTEQNCTVFDLQDKLHDRGWTVPAYTCPSGATDFAILRVVVKQNFSMPMADMLADDFKLALAYFDKNPARQAKAIPKLERRDSQRVALAKDALVGRDLKHCLRHRLKRTKTQGVC